MKIILFCIGFVLSILHPTSNSFAGSGVSFHAINLVHIESLPQQDYSQDNDQYVGDYLTGILDDDTNESERKNSLLSKGSFKLYSFISPGLSSKTFNGIWSARIFFKFHVPLFVFLGSLRL